MDNLSQSNSIIENFKRIYDYLPKRRRWQFWILFCGMFVGAVFETLAAGSVAAFMASVANPENVLNSVYVEYIREIIPFKLLYDVNGLVLFSSALSVSTMACYVTAMAIVEIYLCLYAGYASTSLTENLLNGFLNVPYEWILSKNSSDLIHSISWQPQVFYFIRATLKIFCDALAAMILLAVLFFIEPMISIPVSVVAGLLAYIMYANTRKYMDVISNKVKSFKIVLNRQTHSIIHGIKDIKVYGRESLFTSRYQDQAKIEVRPFAFQHAIPQFSHLILQLAGLFIITMAVYAMLMILKTSAARAMGAIALMAVTAWRILPAVNRILHNLNSARVTIPHTKHILGYLAGLNEHRVTKSFSDDKKPYIVQFEREILFKSVSFAYGSREKTILKDLDFKICRGTTIGIVGVSGAGKSTLVDLILGLLPPSSGKILIDDRPFGNDHSGLLLGKIGYVSQSPYISAGTIAENIAFGFTGNQIDRERVERSCEMASMGAFLKELPKGIDTQIGERGVTLSGGQAQRVAIARALYHSPEMIIFDEATSALDSKNEKAIQSTIGGLKGKLTLIIIAHRLSTIDDCDEIIWLENGSIREIGPPEKILPNYMQVMKEDRSS